MTTTQKGSDRKPYIRVDIVTAEPSTVEQFNSASAGSAEIQAMKIVESAYGGPLSEIVLNNADKSLSDKDYTGRRVKVFMGYDTSGASGSSTETEERAPQWVIRHENLFEEGKLITILTLGDIWHLMAGYPVGGNASTDNKPHLSADEIDDHLSNSVLKLLIPPGYNNTIDSGVSDGVPLTIDETDSIIDNASLQYTFEFDWGQSILAVVQQLMSYTKSGLRMRKRGDDMRSEDLDTTESVVYTYGTDHEVESATKQHGLVLPNRFIAVNVAPNTTGEGGSAHTETTTANDVSSQARMGVYAQMVFPTAGTSSSWNAAKTANAANSHLHQAQQKASTGKFITKPNIGAELWDFVKLDVEADRGWDFTGFITSIEWLYQAFNGIYLQVITLGGNITKQNAYWTSEQVSTWNQATGQYVLIPTPTAREIIGPLTTEGDIPVEQLGLVPGIPTDRPAFEAPAIGSIDDMVAQQMRNISEMFIPEGTQTTEGAIRATQERKLRIEEQIPVEVRASFDVNMFDGEFEPDPAGPGVFRRRVDIDREVRRQLGPTHDIDALTEADISRRIKAIERQVPVEPGIFRTFWG